MALFVSGKLFNKAGEGSGGGGDSHNKGFFATVQALQEAYPTAEDGDYAIVGATDTVWLWDSDSGESGAWVDGDTKGQVTSVNGQTGDVVITPSSIGALENEATGLNSLSILASTGGYVGSVAIGKNCYANEGPQNVVVGADSSAYRYGVAVGQGSQAGNSASGADNTVAIGRQAKALGTGSIQLGHDGTNSDNNTFKVANANGNFEIMSANGTVPTDRFTTTPTVAGTYSATIVVDGQGNITRSWATAPDTLPSQTGQSGKFLTTDGTDASWSDKPLVNKATGTNSLSIDSAIAATASNCVNIGSFSRGGTNCTKIGYAAGGSDDIPEDSVFIGAFTEDINNGSQANAIGCYAHAGAGALAIGYRAQANNGNIQLVMNYFGRTPQANGDVNTFKVANANGNFKIMSADGTIPTARLTKVNSTITLAAADWSSNTQTVNVTGMTADGVVFPCPIPADQADYTAAGIICSAQASGTLTFTCDTVPSGDIDVTVVMM